MTFGSGNQVVRGAVFKGGGLTVIISFDVTKHGVLRHVAISHKHRYPTWEEIKAVRGVFFPASVDAMLVLHPEGDTENILPNCFHLWQMPAPWDVRSDGERRVEDPAPKPMRTAIAVTAPADRDRG